MNSKELYVLVEEYYGYKIKMQYMNSQKNEVGGIIFGLSITYNSCTSINQ